MKPMLSRFSNPAWINICVMAGASFLIFALFLSAVFDPKISLLHALIYIAVILLTRHEIAWGLVLALRSLSSGTT
jgi:hypothetical protein